MLSHHFCVILFLFHSSGLVLNSIMVAFKAIYISARATQFVDLITACDDDGKV